MFETPPLGHGALLKKLLPSRMTEALGGFCAHLHINAKIFRSEAPERSFLNSLGVESLGIEPAAPMPRYFFHVYHEGLQVDRVGEELPDKNAAWKEATATAGRLLQDIDGELLLSKQPWRLEVTDEFATPLFELWIGARRPT